MRIGEISFCNRIGYNIKSDETKKTILEDLEKLNQKVIQKHHDNFSESSFTILQTNPHLMTLKSNGNPYYLYLTKYNGANQCIFIDRKVQHGYFYPRMVVVKFWFDDQLFESTVFSGEMVSSSDEWTFVINDLVADSGLHQDNVNLIKRLNRAYEILSNCFEPDPVQDVCTFEIKRYFHYNEHNEMNAFMNSLPYTCRGIYFRPLFLRFRDILYNFDDSLVKKVEKEKFKTFMDKNQGGDGKSGKSEKSESPVTSQDQDQDVPESTDSVVSASSSASASAHVKDELMLPSLLLQQLPPPPPMLAILLVQKTNQPDIYDVHKMTGEHIGIACVNELKTSKLLRERFAKATPVDKIKFNCVLNHQFNKWTPISLA